MEHGRVRIRIWDTVEIDNFVYDREENEVGYKSTT